MPNKKCTVVVKNESLDSNEPHKYSAYFVPQDVIGGSLTHTLQPIFFLSDSLHAESQAEFTISSKLLAVIAYKSGGSPKDMISNGDNIIVQTTREIHLGYRGDNGSALVVTWDSQEGCPVFDKDLEKEIANKGSFSITCSASIPHENRYSVGLARIVDNGRARPVAVMPCYPQKLYEFTPKEEIYIERVPYNINNTRPGTVVARKSGLRAKFSLQFNNEDVMVREMPAGFTVNGRANDPSALGNEEQLYWKATSFDPSLGVPPLPIPRLPSISNAHMKPPHHPTFAGGPGSQYSSDDKNGGKRSSDTQNQPTLSLRHLDPDHKEASTKDPVRHTSPHQDLNGAEAQNSAEPSNVGLENLGDDDEDNESVRALSRLQSYHTVFVVDDTASMQLPAHGDFTGVRQLPRNIKGPTRWEMAVEALEYIADEAVKHDESGIDMHFLIKSVYRKRGIKTGEEVRQVLGKIDLRRNWGPTKFEPVLRTILGGHLRAYRKAEDNDEKLPQPLDIIFLTDGVAVDETRTEALIVEIAQQLEDLNAYPDQIGIQFVQVGEDKNAAEFLRRLDDDLKTKCDRDIVDTRHYDNQGGVPLKEQLIQILLGAIDRDIDEEE